MLRRLEVSLLSHRHQMIFISGVANVIPAHLETHLWHILCERDIYRSQFRPDSDGKNAARKRQS